MDIPKVKGKNKIKSIIFAPKFKTDQETGSVL